MIQTKTTNEFVRSVRASELTEKVVWGESDGGKKKTNRGGRGLDVNRDSEPIRSQRGGAKGTGTCGTAALGPDRQEGGSAHIYILL